MRRAEPSFPLGSSRTGSWTTLYATDCWGAELLTSYGWICQYIPQKLASNWSSESLGPPKVWEEWDVEVSKKWLGPKFRKDAKKVEEAIARISQDDRERLARE